MAFIRQYVMPLLIVLVFAFTLFVVSARIFLPNDLAAPAPLTEPEPVSIPSQASLPPALDQLVSGPAS